MRPTRSRFRVFHCGKARADYCASESISIMRLIGHLADETSANTFSDYLFVQGITSEVEAGKEGYDIWIHSEDEWVKAGELLAAFAGNPADPTFQREAGRAKGLKAEALVQEEKVASRVQGRAEVFKATNPYGVGALTIALIGVCLVIQLMREGGFDDQVLRQLSIAAIEADGISVRWNPGLGLVEVRNGELWRLFTPAVMHGGWLHLLMNMMWLLDLGSMIEGRQGTRRLGLLVVGLAVMSNFGQYYFTGSPYFGGMSGVIYGLLGYVYVKGRFDPSSGLGIRQQTMIMMMVWFVVCWTGAVGAIANYAHTIGLLAGVAWGFLASIPAMRRAN